MKIGRKTFDKLGNELRDWLMEQGFETNVSQDLELENLILGCLNIEYDKKFKKEVSIPKD